MRKLALSYEIKAKQLAIRIQNVVILRCVFALNYARQIMIEG